MSSLEQTNLQINECDKLLRAVKKEVKQIMEEAVTRKFVHEDSSSIISLCVAVDACLSHGLRRRVLGLFKTNSTTALIQKIAKTCDPAAEVIRLVEQAQDKQNRRTNSATYGETSNHQTRSSNQSNSSPSLQLKMSSNSSSSSMSPLKRLNNKRYLWLKTALLERKLINIVDHLTENANKYYEYDALMSDYFYAQLLSSLLVGPCALDFSRMKTQDHFWTDPSAKELVQRHNMANPIACQCQHTINQQNASSVSMNYNYVQSSAANFVEQMPGGVDDETSENQKTINLLGNSNDSPLSGGRKPLALSQSLKTTMVTDCHHFDCKHSNHRHQSKGYSFTSQDQAPIWSPRMLHETLHQNSKSLLLYAKNNVIMQTSDMQTMPGYLSLHQTNNDLVIKWIPNQMINGANGTSISMYHQNGISNLDASSKQQQQQPENGACLPDCFDNFKNSPDSSDQLNTDDHVENSELERATISTTNSELNNCFQPISTRPQAVESSYLDLVVNLSVNRIVYLHCHEREDSGEETIILVERDGTQRAPFRFPKGGLSAFLSCIESGLLPNSQLDPPLSTKYSEDPINADRIPQIKENEKIAQDSLSQLLKSKLPSLRQKKQATKPSTSSETNQNDSTEQKTTKIVSEDCRQPMTSYGATEKNSSEIKTGPSDYVFRIITPLDKVLQNTSNTANSIISSYNNNIDTPPNSATSDEFSQPSPSGQSATSKYRWNLSRFTQFANIAKYSTSSTNSTGSSSVKSTSINTDESLDSVWSPSIPTTSINNPPITLASSTRVHQADRINQQEVTSNNVPISTQGIVNDASPSNYSTIKKNPVNSEDHSKSTEGDKSVELPTNQSIQTLCHAMRKQIISRAFYGWLSHCRHIRTVRLHLAKLVKKEIISPTQPVDANMGLTSDIWSRLHEDRLGSSSEFAMEIFRLVYFGGIKDASLRKMVWPYLLGHYQFEDSKEKRQFKDNEIREMYYSSMSEWQQIEAAVRQRDRDICAANMAKYSDERLTSKTNKDSVDSVLDSMMKSKDEVFRNEENGLGQDANNIDQSDCNNNNRNSTLASDDRIDECEEGPDDNSSWDKISNKLTETVDPIEKIEAIERRKRQCRFDSTGSVGSDASITERFGCNIHGIDKDVQRCDRNFWYFTNTANLDKLKNVMCSYVWKNLDVGYVQGMCDLAAPFLVVFDDEVMAYSCFSLLMERMVTNFPHGGAMDQHFASLRYLLQVLDPELFDLMQSNGDYTHFYFCYRWLLLDFKRELTYEDVFRVWEMIWAAKHISTDSFVLFVALAMIKYYRDIIIENNMDFTDTIKFFNEMAERHDAQRIVSLAKECVLEVQNMLNA